MGNNRNVMTSLLTVGAAGAAIYGISKGIQNGTFQKLPQKMSDLMGNPTIEQVTEPIQNMMNNQDTQDLIQNNTGQSMQDQIANENKQW
ncbi:hypothetical protein [Ornithinibacillus halophilus]|uniref:Uncharacterized protein n=1 Tax=Ornithinibacillus halophilus TaxID=930117 RepID=A0A1M5FKL5_9BACI|nr:hypothetical protein [Ornithinibacillus halophilus]SHF91969.1 hypothetical protein SAMN05216225_100915 [Ornithinibacillus halophilus]